MSKSIRLILADDHAMLRQGTVSLLSRENDLNIVAEAGNGLQAVELTKQLKPDIVIMDVRMPLMNGIEATRAIHDECPQSRVLVLTAHDDDQYVFSLLEAGASGYILKTAPVSELIQAIRQVQVGESPLAPSIARKVVTHMQGKSSKHKSSGKTDSSTEDLTPRELEVLQMLARGMSNQAIGKTLFISDRTVQAHFTSIFAKMKVASRLDAVVTAIRRGWLVLESEAELSDES